MGQATAVVEDTKVDAQGVPQNSTLKIQESVPEVDKIIDEMASAKKETGEELFRYDISVQDQTGLEWQPNGKVRMELAVPGGQKLHKHQPVYVVHVSDDGEANYIDAQVSDAGTIVFETDSFSTFAGFTVDFEYDGDPFSINGYDSILLSDLMDNLKMPVYVRDVQDVTFSNYKLISVEKQGEDWLLTSLMAFTSVESLKVIMKDGTVYDITVKDATAYPTLTYHSNTYQDPNSDGYIVWFSDGDGDLCNLTKANNGNQTPECYTLGSHGIHNGVITVDGSGATNKQIILLLRPSRFASSFMLCLQQIRVTGGAKVIVRVSE